MPVSSFSSGRCPGLWRVAGVEVEGGPVRHRSRDAVQAGVAEHPLGRGADSAVAEHPAGERADEHAAASICAGVTADGLDAAARARRRRRTPGGSCVYSGGRTRPLWYAITTSCARSRAPSFTIARLTWVLAVAALTTSVWAISWLLSPPATSAITSRSRSVSSRSASGRARRARL